MCLDVFFLLCTSSFFGLLHSDFHFFHMETRLKYFNKNVSCVFFSDKQLFIEQKSFDFEIDQSLIDMFLFLFGSVFIRRKKRKIFQFSFDSKRKILFRIFYRPAQALKRRFSNWLRFPAQALKRRFSRSCSFESSMNFEWNR